MPRVRSRAEHDISIAFPEPTLIVGLDIGTQSLKAVVATDGLEVLGQSSVAYEPSYPHPGAAEQDTHVWERALAPAIKSALEAAKVDSGDVQALS
ncbi:MAG: FGGY family carbohydrate kinase, partial [Gammaproteobacteria bacterium]|nr:FGGY family carbohydrate kinase [Gammaproteobacteria bacterium]